MADESVKQRQGSLVNKLRWPIMASVMVVLLIMGLVLIPIGRRSLRQQIFRVQRKTAEEVAISIASYLQSAQDDLFVLAQARDWSKLSRDEKEQALERFWLEQQDIYEEITFLDRAGTEVAKYSRYHTYLPEELGSQAHAPAFQRAVAGERFLAEEIEISPDSGLPIVELAVPVSDPSSGDSIGVLLARASIGQMWNTVAEVEVGGTGYVYVVNRAGRMLAHSNLERYLKLRDEKLSDVPVVQRVRFGLEGPAASQYEGLNGDSVVGAFAPIEDTYWVTIVELPTTEAYATTRRMTVTWLGLMLATVLAIGGLTSWLPQRIVRRPLAELEEGAALLSRGDLEHRITLRTGDELEALADTFNQMAEHLQELYAGLEQKVADRTRDLERRAVQLEAAAEVARDAVAIRDVSQLLDEAVHLISDQFGFYHAGIFLLDDAKEYAILEAASSEGGRRMLERGHKLRVGQVGIVGYVAGTGEPRIALDVGEDAVFFDNPDMPRTRSEMALPLEVRWDIIGVLDVQSTEAAAFDEEDVAILRTMADQLAVAIENARLLEESRRAVEELRVAQGEYVRTAWGQSSRPSAFEYDRIDVKPVGFDSSPLIDRALSVGRVIAETEPHNGRSALVAPLRLRDQPIGVISLEETDEARAWTEDEVELVKEVSEQVALALENARLFTDAQQRAVEQEGLARIAALTSSTLDRSELLTQVVEEVRQLIRAESAVLLLLDEEERVLVGTHLSVEGKIISVPEHWRVPLDAPGFEHGVFARGGAYYSNTGIGDPNIIPAYRPYMDELGVRNFCGVALRVRDQSIGELYLVNRAEEFGENEVRLLQTAAGYVSNAIENTRLFEEARIRAEELAVLNELGRALSAQIDEEEVLREAYQAASDMLDTTSFYVALYDQEAESISFPIYSEEGEWIQRQSRELKNGLTEYIIHNRTGLLLRQDPIERATEMGIDVRGRPALSWLGVPLMIGDQVLGVMAVQSYATPRLYDQHDQDLLTSIASQTAIALESARLFEQVQRRARRERLIREVSARIVGSTDLDTVLRTTAQELSKVLGTSGAAVRLKTPEGGVE